MLYHPDPDRQLFLQIDGFIERSFGIIIYHLKRDFQWQPIKNVPATAIEPVIFFSRCLIKKKLYYRSSELEIVYLVWAYKRLRTLLHSNNHRIVVLTDHKVIRSIVYHSILNITFIDCTNRKLTNASVYLSVYLLEVYYISGRFNYMSDVLSCLRAIDNDVV